MDRDTIDHIISQLADIIVSFEQALLSRKGTINQGMACGLIAQARARLIEDMAILPAEALCEVQE